MGEESKYAARRLEGRSRDLQRESNPHHVDMDCTRDLVAAVQWIIEGSKGQSESNESRNLMRIASCHHVFSRSGMECLSIVCSMFGAEVCCVYQGDSDVVTGI